LSNKYGRRIKRGKRGRNLEGKKGSKVGKKGTYTLYKNKKREKEEGAKGGKQKSRRYFRELKRPKKKYKGKEKKIKRATNTTKKNLGIAFEQRRSESGRKGGQRNKKGKQTTPGPHKASNFSTFSPDSAIKRGDRGGGGDRAKSERKGSDHQLCSKERTEGKR